MIRSALTRVAVAAIVAVIPLQASGEILAAEAHANSTRLKVANVCPDGRYEGNCSSTEILQAIAFAPDKLPAPEPRCFYRTQARCHVIATGRIQATAMTVVWQHMTLSPPDGPIMEMMVLGEQTETHDVKLIGASQVDGYFSPPDLVADDENLLLIHVPGVRAGSGAGNADLVLKYTDDGWQGVDLSYWAEQVNTLLPQGLSIHNSARLDLREMHASSPVWRDSDGNCCATGGTVQIDFTLDGNVLIASRIALSETTPTGPTRYIEAKPGADSQ
ncbi:hypothetical protein MB02_10290 [Croceicoccus estronivorus]|uniref:hypothetical protein n=1 Tax=Croceicoccus estronivorus TaxID=1172626 RepID=UPI0008333756|nr:hypothetical protein [Croceicoccus estronivorus]OCC23560.1 hypothetical protein MB02_10290 [Croceicoccus estronivorus]